MMTKKKDFVHVAKMFDLQENESVADLCRKICQAIHSYLQDKSMFNCNVFAIYMDYLILQDYGDGGWYKVEYVRDGEEIVLSEPTEVEILFVSKESMKKSEQATSPVERHTLKPTLFQGIL